MVEEDFEITYVRDSIKIKIASLIEMMLVDQSKYL